MITPQRSAALHRVRLEHTVRGLNMKKYCCDDWDNNIKKVDMPILLQSIRAGRDLYDGLMFRFCPWCGGGIEEQLSPEQIPSIDEMRGILSNESSNK